MLRLNANSLRLIALRIVLSSMSESNGLIRNSSAPRLIAFTAAGRSTWPERKIIGMSQRSVAMRSCSRHASNRSVTANTYCICANDSGNLSTGLYVVSRRDENEEIVVNSGHPHCAFSLWRHIDELPAAEFTAKKRRRDDEAKRWANQSKQCGALKGNLRRLGRRQCPDGQPCIRGAQPSGLEDAALVCLFVQLRARPA
jgi:hypothetical protein